MRTPDWKLERYLLGELEPEELERIRAEAESDDALRDRLAALRRSDDEIRERYPAAWMSRQIRNRLSQEEIPKTRSERQPQPFFLKRHLVPVSAVGVVLLALVIWPNGPTTDNGRPGLQPPIGERIKGLEPELQLYRKMETGSERLSEGALAREHDLIMIRYQPAGRLYGAILSVDGRGTVTRHLPAEGKEAVALPQDGVTSLGFAYELDNAPHGESFFFVTSEAPFELDAIVRAARGVRPRPAPANGGELPDSLELAPGLDQTILTLEKDATHE